jgi:Tfp pilus assembly protein PilO
MTKNTVDNQNFWRAVAAVLFALLVMSWGYFQFVSMMNDSAFETLAHHRTEIRNLNNQLIQLNIKLEDMQNKNRMLESRIDTFNNMRVRDHEQVMSQINAATIKRVR